MAKAGVIPPIISWLQGGNLNSQAAAAQALLNLAMDNPMTQIAIAKSHGIPPLIALVRQSSQEGQDYAARALFHLASNAENKQTIAESGGIKPLVSMLSAEWPSAAELAALLMVRLMQDQPFVSKSIADKGGIVPLVKLLSDGSLGAQQQAGAMLAEMALVPEIRDQIANAGGIKKMIALLTSGTFGTPEIVARTLANLALSDPSAGTSSHKGTPDDAGSSGPDDAGVQGSDERRMMILANGGVKHLIAMLDGSNVPKDVPTTVVKSIGMPANGQSMGMREQAAATLADLALDSAEMQDAIIELQSVPNLLALIRNGSPLGQEHAARAIRNLVTRYPVDESLIENQLVIVENGTIPDLVQLTKTGSQKAQEIAAAGISELASGAVFEREMKEAKAAKRKEPDIQIADLKKMQRPLPEETLAPTVDITLGSLPGARARRMSYSSAEGTVGPSPQPSDRSSRASQPSSRKGKSEGSTDRLVLISEAGGITPLITMLFADNNLARENAAGALMHLALDPQNAIAIAKSNGISPLVTLLDDGTEQAHKHAAEAIQRLASGNEDNQTQSAKHLVALLASESAGAQCRTADVLSTLAAKNKNSPVIIVNAGAISPLVSLLRSGMLDVKLSVADALKNLSLNSPETQLAIATGVVGLLGAGSTETQEHVTRLLLLLVRDRENCIAVSKTTAIPRLTTQLQSSSNEAQELSAAVLAQLAAASDGNVESIATSGATKPLVSLLGSVSAVAQAHIGAILSNLARISTNNQMEVVAEGGIEPLVAILATEQLQTPAQATSQHTKAKEELTAAKAEAAGALLYLALEQPDTGKVIANADAIRLLVDLLHENVAHACIKAAGAITALAKTSRDNQDTVERNKGIHKLVQLLDPPTSNDVQAEVAGALAALCNGNKNNQDVVAQVGGIRPLVALLESDCIEHAKEEAARALWALATKHYENQVAIANAGGIAPLTAVLGLGARAQELAGGALAALALDNAANEESIAKLIVSLLGSDDKTASAKAARAISRLARENAANQIAIARAGGIRLLVKLLGVEGGKGEEAQRKEMADAIWSMAAQNPENQTAIAEAGGIPLLISMLSGSLVVTDTHRVVAGALWSLAGNPGHTSNQLAIASGGGITMLVKLLKPPVSGGVTPGVMEASAGALWAIAEAYDNRFAIAEAGGVPSLVGLVDTGTQQSKEHAAGALRNLVVENEVNQREIAHGLVEILTLGSASGKEHATTLLRNLAEEPENRKPIAKAGAILQLVVQLERGTEKATSMAAEGLGFIALTSQQHRSAVTNELVKLLASTDEAVRQRASEALRDMAAEREKSGKKVQLIATGGVQQVDALVRLLKDGLADDRVEAQEYALLSLAAVNDAASKEAIVDSGGIASLIASLRSGRLSAVAQEHAATVLSSLSGAMEQNAVSVRDAGGVEPLVRLLSQDVSDAKTHAALALAQLARHAGAGSEIAEAGGVSTFVSWLMDANRGPPDIAARALTEIASNNPITQTQIAEEGAISPLVAAISNWAQAAAIAATTGGMTSRGSSKVSTALKLATVAAAALAALAEDNGVNQITIAEENGISPLLELMGEQSEKAIESATKALWRLGQDEDNQTSIPAAGGVPRLVTLLNSLNETTQQYAAAALQSLVRAHPGNQIALTAADAIAPLAGLLGSNSKETQVHAVGTLLHLASNRDARNAVVERLVGVLHVRNAAAQMKACEALAVLSARSNDNRKAITAAQAILPLVQLLGDGRRVRANTPQERAAAVLADLARLSENKETIIQTGCAGPLVAMLTADSTAAQAHSASALCHLAAAAANKEMIANSNAIEPLVNLLGCDSIEAQKSAMGALYQLAAIDKNRGAMVAAGIIPHLVTLLSSDADEARESAVAVLSTLALSQGGKGNKKSIAHAGAIEPLIALLSDGSTNVQKHAACTLWSLAMGKDGVYDRHIVELGAVEPLIKILLLSHPDTCGYAAACLSCMCNDEAARRRIIEGGAVDPLLTLAQGPGGWLRTQATEMLKLLGIPFTEPEHSNPRFQSPRGETDARPMSATKVLPIRVKQFIDPNQENPKVGELQTGDVAYVLERREVETGVWRALVTRKPGEEPSGWVTAAKNGADFLVPSSASKAAGSALKDMEFRFWPHQVRSATVDCVHFA